MNTKAIIMLNRRYANDHAGAQERAQIHAELDQICVDVIHTRDLPAKLLKDLGLTNEPVQN
jgi:hypothetical protein